MKQFTGMELSVLSPLAMELSVLSLLAQSRLSHHPHSVRSEGDGYPTGS